MPRVLKSGNGPMKTYCLALDLHDAPDLIAEYKPLSSTKDNLARGGSPPPRRGVLSEEIYQLGTRMVMILRTTDGFSFEAKAASDRANPKMQPWEDRKSVV